MGTGGEELRSRGAILLFAVCSIIQDLSGVVNGFFFFSPVSGRKEAGGGCE
jgi:hypothetical protein